MKASILEDFFRSETAVGFFVEKVNGDTLDSAKIFVKKKKKNSVLKLRFIADSKD